MGIPATKEFFSGGFNAGIVDRWPGIFVIIGGLLMEFIVFGFSDNWASFSSPFHEDSSMGNPSFSSIAVAVSLANGLSPFTGIVAGFLLMKFNPRVCLLIALCCIFLYLWLTSTVVHKVWHIYLTYGIIGSMAIGFAFTTVVSVVNTWFSKYRALATSILVLGNGLGDIVIAPTLGYLLDKYSWRKAMRFLSIFCIPGLIGALLLRMRPGYDVEAMNVAKEEAEELEVAKLSEPTEENVNTRRFTTFELLRYIVPTRTFVTLFLSFFVYNGAFVSATFLMVPYATAMGKHHYKNEKEIKIEKAANLFTFYGVAYIFASLLAGISGTKFGPQIVCIFALGMMGTVSMFWALCRKFYAFAIIAVFLGTGDASVFSTLPAIIGDRYFGSNVGPLTGMVFSSGIATMITPPIVASIAEHMDTNNYTVSCIFVGILYYISMHIVIFGIPRLSYYKFYRDRIAKQNIEENQLNMVEQR